MSVSVCLRLYETGQGERERERDRERQGETTGDKEEQRERVKDTERERGIWRGEMEKSEGGRDIKRKSDRERECVCVHVCMHVFML